MATALRGRQSTLWQPLFVTRPRRLQCEGPLRRSSSFADLSKEMLSRPARVYRDWPVITPSDLLDRTLYEVFASADSRFQHRIRDRTSAPLGYHLVYFPVPRTIANHLPDGTDALHSPGPPFTRRMWAGGTLRNYNGPLCFDGTQHLCRERITDVQIKGPELDEKIFVTISLWIGSENVTIENGHKRSHPSVKVKEDRTLVFMRDRAPNDGNQERSSDKILKPTEQADYSRIITPTAQLLFRFSALTWNAHKIHLDRQYCLEVEGHRNLLVHGPLTVILMLKVLREYLWKLSANGAAKEQIVSVEYRNLAPLYAEEPMRVCVKRKEDKSFSLWIEGRDGGYAVKGKAMMKKLRVSKVRHMSLAEGEDVSNPQGEAK